MGHVRNFPGRGKPFGYKKEEQKHSPLTVFNFPGTTGGPLQTPWQNLQSRFIRYFQLLAIVFGKGKQPCLASADLLHDNRVYGAAIYVANAALVHVGSPQNPRTIQNLGFHAIGSADNKSGFIFKPSVRFLFAARLNIRIIYFVGFCI
jgi:hypothetical protein